MLKHRNKIIAAVVILIVLAAAFLWGGDSERLHGWDVAGDTDRQTEAVAEVSDSDISHASDEKPADGNSDSDSPVIDAEKATDEYQTEPVPEGKPEPVEPESTEITDEKLYCTISVSCAELLSHMDYLSSEKASVVPSDGVVLSERRVEFYEGENAFNVLQRELKKAKVHLEFSSTPVYNSVYIEGINNLYEFDAGELSGWIYSVNGWFPNYGCSRYKLENGDKIEWHYTCDRYVQNYYNADE